MRALLAALLLALPAAAAAEPELTIYNDEQGGENLLWLCSRGAPEPYDGRWEVTVADVAAAEFVLVQQHKRILRNAGIDVDTFTNDYVHEYAGFTRDGRRFLYGSFGPMSGVGLCDGGPQFFGVEFAQPDNEVTHVAYNGVT